MAIRTILIPLDESEFSRRIVRVVRTFISPDDVELVLFRAAHARTDTVKVDPNETITVAMKSDSSFEPYIRALDTEYDAMTQQRAGEVERVEAELAEEVERLRNAGYTARAEVQFGEAAQRIIDYANENHVDLIAMTTHGRSGLGRLVLGSVAERVARRVSVPVLLMRSTPPDMENTDPDQVLSRALGNAAQLRIALATDGSTQSQRAVARTSELARALHAEIDLLVVMSDEDSVDQGRNMIKEAMEQVAGMQPRPRATPLVGYADEVLLLYLAEHPVDILAIGAIQDRGAGSTAAIGPTAQRLVQHSPTNVFICKGHRPHIGRILTCLSVDDAEIVDAAAHLAQATGAELSLLHVIPPSAASYLSAEEGTSSGATSPIALSQVLSQGTPLSTLLKSWIMKLAEHGIGQEAVLLAKGSVPEAILKTAQDGAYDLVVVGSNSSPGHYPGSIANSIVRYAEQSVLLLRNEPT